MALGFHVPGSMEGVPGASAALSQRAEAHVPVPSCQRMGDGDSHAQGTVSCFSGLWTCFVVVVPIMPL